MNTQAIIHRRREAAKRLSVSLATLDRMVKDGRLPAPIRLSTRRVGWPSTVIDQFINSKSN